jgi:hypothetical protein
MLENGHPEARSFLPQLEHTSVTDYRCPCGCATINLAVEGFSEQTGGLHILADFLFGDKTTLSGILFMRSKDSWRALKSMAWLGMHPRHCRRLML